MIRRSCLLSLGASSPDRAVWVRSVPGALPRCPEPPRAPEEGGESVHRLVLSKKDVGHGSWRHASSPYSVAPVRCQRIPCCTDLDPIAAAWHG
jgi:hypothetical protein